MIVISWVAGAGALVLLGLLVGWLCIAAFVNLPALMYGKKKPLGLPDWRFGACVVGDLMLVLISRDLENMWLANPLALATIVVLGFRLGRAKISWLLAGLFFAPGFCALFVFELQLLTVANAASALLLAYLVYVRRRITQTLTPSAA